LFNAQNIISRLSSITFLSEVIKTGTVPLLEAAYNSVGLSLSEISLSSTEIFEYESAILARIA
tara:strand:- start:20 stop:208 length:189 start_codon:yes stop_codon:yes gene_type:complete